MAGPKATSFAYGRDLQLRQAEKYRNRRSNHWKHRIDLAHRLVQRYALPRLRGKPRGEICLVDVGCSIGTFAIEFAKLGYRSYGIDFDESALGIAHQLAREENVSPEFVCGDVSDWTYGFPRIDIAICFDIFEHLHDDELGSFLNSVRRQMSREGSLVFRTFPTQYDWVVFGPRRVRYPLALFRCLSPPKFGRTIKAYSCLLDAISVLTTGQTHRDGIKLSGHCNPTTAERLSDILTRAGYEIVCLESANLYCFKSSVQRKFASQPVTHRNLYGVAVSRSK